ncbi:hypothetical protein RirG_144390 [Rhizophagus irregularis DAOM 197198w]|uniref:HCP-like protein n=1 Tax=Rhizophagus irregularis (strain DAOM 197198w) TaxID=1432141 RepID=A0A015KW86_RHIIW|nr:hypothetical protein RirG_144390 [Rhizophagus irregularis DAOM 197198w]
MNDNTKVQDAYKYYQPDNNYLELSNFYKVNVMEIKPTTQDINENIFEEDLSDVIDKLVNLYFEETNKGKEERERKKFLLNNQTSSNSIYLFGYFNYHGIGTDINKQIALGLYQKAAELENFVAQFDLACMYLYGAGTDKNYNKAFKLLEKLSRRKHTYGMKWLGHCYKFGYGTVKNMDKATYWYKKSSSLGSKYVLNN